MTWQVFAQTVCLVALKTRKLYRTDYLIKICFLGAFFELIVAMGEIWQIRWRGQAILRVN